VFFFFFSFCGVLYIAYKIYIAQSGQVERLKIHGYESLGFLPSQYQADTPESSHT